jgi:hypothetical protein
MYLMTENVRQVYVVLTSKLSRKAEFCEWVDEQLSGEQNRTSFIGQEVQSETPLGKDF